MQPTQVTIDSQGPDSQGPCAGDADASAGRVSRRSFLGGATAVTLALPEAARAKSAQAWDETTDVVVVGGGAAGGVAAATARAAGAQVILCEKAGFLGGTTAKSGGAYWIPNNFDLQARKVADPKPDFLRYAARTSYPVQYNPEHPTLGLPELAYGLLGAYYDHANEMVQHLAALGALQSTAYMSYDGVSYLPDYQEHLPEDVTPRGRILAPKRADGSIGAGDDLMAQLATYLRRAGVKILLDAPVIDLVQDSDRAVTGVVVRTADGTRTIRARRGVVFCSGGYSQNHELLREYQPGPIVGRCGLPTCTGDFVQLGVRAGARLGNMSGAWRTQCVLEQALIFASLPDEVWFPIGDSTFVVNKYGRRCFNERSNYHDRTRQSYLYDANRAEYPNLFTFQIYDQRTAERFGGDYPLPDEPLGEPYVMSGNTLEDLAAALDARLGTLTAHTGGVRLDGSFVSTLKDTFVRFNRYAREGSDPDHGRGQYAYDAAWQREETPRSGTKWPPNPYPSMAMHPLSDTGPYFAMILGPAVLDTNGGPEIDPTGAVLDSSGHPIPGLYGAGNCIASPAGGAYWGAGATIGNAMTFGYVAGRSAAMRRST
jgi:succinate dehydrogenase/fumarate reductase flavoprotein subunit